jgi:hypothetical protein
MARNSLTYIPDFTVNLGTFWLKIEQFWPFEEILFLAMVAILDTGRR